MLAEAARTSIGFVLGVVDAGADVTDAICAPKNASLDDLANAAAAAREGQVLLQPRLYGTVSRSLTVAWRLHLQPNPPAPSWRNLPEFTGRWWARERPPFIADGLRAQGDALIRMTNRKQDCSAAIDAALVSATRDALSKAHGHLRYLEEDSSGIVGPSASNEAAVAEVHAGY